MVTKILKEPQNNEPNALPLRHRHEKKILKISR
jgi:hypothetical protein